MVLKRELFLLCLVSAACGSDDDAEPSTSAIDAGIDRLAARPDVGVGMDPPPSDAAADVVVTLPDAACNVVAQTQPLEAAVHVPEGTVIT